MSYKHGDWGRDFTNGDFKNGDYKQGDYKQGDYKQGDEFDVEFFDMVDFNLLDDDGQFENFCLSMDFNPLSEADTTDAERTITPAPGSPTKKRKLGSVKPTASLSSSSLSSSGVTDSSGSGFSDCMDVDGCAQPKPAAPKAMSNKKFTRKLLTDRDIRTRFATLFCDAFNNFDKVYFGQILKNYCEEDLLVIYEYVGVNPYNSPNYMEVRGFDTVAVFWDGLLTSIPDSLFEIHSTKYKILPNDFTSIVCTFSFVGTKVFQLTGVDGAADRNVVISSEASGPRDSSSSASRGRVVASTVADRNAQLSSNDSAEAAAFAVEKSQMLSIKITVIGTLTFYVNSNKKIYRISFVHSMKA